MRNAWSLVLVGVLAAWSCGQGLIYTYDGLAQGDSLGISVRDAGDIDQDGFGDYIMGAFFADTPNGIDSGAAYVYSGQTGALLFNQPGSAAGDRFGVAVAGGGDVTGDGIPDFAVGAPRNDIGGADAGAVAVYSGATGNLARVIVGPAGSNLGESVSMGDLDGDGLAEIACCAFTQTYQGRAYVYNSDGTLRFQLFPTGTTSGWTSYWGFGIDMVGDHNGDGIGDICVVPYNVVSTFGGGSTLSTVFSGADGSIIRTLSYTNFDPYRAVAGAGDLNGDGVDDLVIGKPANGSIFGGGTGSTALGAVSGADGSLLWTVTSDPIWGYWPIWVDGIGDLDGDGVNDVLAGSGNANLGTGFSLTTVGSFQAFSGANGGLLFSVYGESQNGYFGARVSRLDDMNGDGVDDIIVGQYGQNGSTGRVKVISGWYTLSPWALSVSKGVGCGGGAQPPLAAADDPRLGSTTNVKIRRGPAGANVALVIDPTWPSPWSFNPQCQVWVDLANINTWTWLPAGAIPANGTLDVPFAVPNIPALAGTPLTIQPVFASPGPAYAFGNGLFVQIGS